MKKLISEKLIGLRKMRLLSLKYCLTVLDEIDHEIYKEDLAILKRDAIRARKKLIGK